ncbi:N-acetyl-gamma-glutamyl-phosphate reductase [bacterium]|nr:N-acetyl-gamma-glutamyl-phosphate reductase [bacterium]
MASSLSVGIVGATGYTGVELVRLLYNHPKVKITSLTSQQYAGEAFSSVYPSFLGRVDLKCEKINVPAISKKVKVVFLCLPHHEAMNVAAAFRARGVKVVDLSADFRLKDPSVYETWYGPHSQKKLLPEAVYGLPEIYAADIKKAKLIASPGCYPTSITLGLAPLLKKGMISSDDIICDSKSGTSGAGRSAKVDSLFCEVNDSFKAYNIARHRHTPEIEQELSGLAGEKVTVLFSPHLVPMDRGILSTIYVRPKRRWNTAELIKVYQQFYKKSYFVNILPEGKLPTTKEVRGTNFCHIGVLFDPRTDRIVVVSAIDNLTKGASGQSIQAFNLMMGFPEKTGLTGLSLYP